MAVQLGPGRPDSRFLQTLRVGKERFLKPARMVRGALALAYALIVLLVAGIAVGGWFLLASQGAILYIAGLAGVGALALYAASDRPYVKPVAVVVFDIVMPVLLAVPLVFVAGLQVLAGRAWLSAGSRGRLRATAAATAVKQP